MSVRLEARSSRRPWAVVIAVVAVAGTALAVSPPAVTPAAPKAATHPAAKAGDQRTIQALIAQGQAALTAEDLKDARDAFTDVVSVDPKNAAALASLGYTHLRLENFPRARDALEAAMSFSQAAAQKPARSLVLNIAAVLVRTRNPMRAAKYIREYMAGHPETTDEQCLNALGTALMSADDQTKGARYFADSVTFYEANNTKLEATRPGEKRWGAQWMPAAKADAKIKQYKAQLAEVDRYQRDMNAATGRFNDADAAKTRALSQARMRRTYVDVSGYDSQMATANREYEAAKKKREEAVAKIERPPFETVVAYVSPDSDAAGTGGTETVAAAPATPAVASAALPRSPALTPPAGGGPLFPGTPGPVAPAAPQPTVPAVTAKPPAGAGNPRPAANPPAAAPVAVPVAPPAPPAPPPPRVVVAYAAAFPVAPDLLVTAAAAVENASRVTVQASDGNPMDAQVVTADAGSGLALLKVPGHRLAYLPLADTFAGGQVQSVSFPTVNIFDPAAEAIGGSAVPPKEGGWQVRLTRHPRLAGGPLLAGGKVVGVQLAARDSETAQIPAATLADLKKLVGAQAGPAAGAADPVAVTMHVTATKQRG